MDLCVALCQESQLWRRALKLQETCRDVVQRLPTYLPISQISQIHVTPVFFCMWIMINVVYMWYIMIIMALIW
jgi:hypothetical protein